MQAERQAFLELFPRCARCGDGGVSVHEIIGGSNRMRAFQTRALWLPACGPCNCDDFTNHEQWPIARQLLLKLIVDPEFFSIAEANRILAPEGARIIPQAITADDVLFWAARYFRDLNR